MIASDSRRGILRFLLPAIPLVSILSLIAMIAPGGLRLASPGILLTFFGICLSIAAWIVYLSSISRPLKRLLAMGGEVGEELEELSRALVKVSTGDLATTIAVRSAGTAGVATTPAISGDLRPFGELLGRLGSSLSESVAGFLSLTDPPCRRLCYVGSDSFAEGKVSGEAIGRLMGGRGKLGILVSDIRSVNHALRRKGALSIIAEKFPEIAEAETLDTHESPDETYRQACEMMKRHPDMKVIYVSFGGTAHFAAKAVIDLKREGKTVVVCHDITPETMEYLAKGAIASTLSQDPYAQGYDPIIRIYNHVVAGWEPAAPRFLTTLESVNRDNYKKFLNSEGGAAEAASRRDLASIDGKRPDRPLKIAVLCASDSGFWAPVARGAQDAGRALAGRGVKVEWIKPKAAAEGFLSASTYAPAIRDLVARKYDGISLPIFDRRLVPVINEAVAAGLTVATFNSEPLSLREMVSSVSSHAVKLIGVSQELAASATETGKSTERIGATMGKISSALQHQSGVVGRTADDIETLAENIGRVNEAAGASAELTKRMAKASQEDFEALGETREAVKSVLESASLARDSIDSLRSAVDEISSRIAVIGDIANQTSILAINASIEAARAGERGKGFSVLAGEIRKLAEQSTRSASEIDGLVSGIRNNVKVAYSETIKGAEEARKNAETAEKSALSLTEINNLAQENEKKMETIFTAVEAMQGFSRQVAASMRSLSEANEKSTGAVDEIASSAGEMAAQAIDVAKTATGLSETAKGQQILLSQFRLGSEGADGTGPRKRP